MAWKKSEYEAPTTNPGTPAVTRPTGKTELATIGPSISIKGDLAGEEDLLIQGRVEGEISLRSNNVTVGQSGQVKADIHGRSIRVEGEVRGNLYGQEEILIRKSGTVEGNIVAPRVTLENGSKFKGSIDMEPKGKAKPEVSAPAAAKPAAETAAPKPGGMKPQEAPSTDRKQ